VPTHRTLRALLEAFVVKDGIYVARSVRLCLRCDGRAATIPQGDPLTGSAHVGQAV
jgi:hypothetical protein